jgi:class 3 adenylate cyclase/predicted ATPase
MFCDLVGSTALSSRLDPEDMREIIGAYHRCCAEQITKVGGFVAKYIGDGVLAYFGYPQAHEDDAERAVRGALSLTEAVAKLHTSHDAVLQVRIGISTGLVVVGDLIGEGAAQEQAVVGETPNHAARLQTLAEPGQVVISNSTRRLTGGMFEYRDLGRVALKGLADPVQAWRVLGTSEVESRFEAQHGHALTPLVGREEELELLLRRWRQAKGGDGSVVLISGEPGIGKSRIIQALLERVSNEPHTRLRYFCSPHQQDTALYPTINQLERAAGFRRDDTDEQRLAKLEAVLGQATNDPSESVPLLAALLSIPTGDRYPPLDLTPQKSKEKTLTALTVQVEGLAARQPVLMVVEDAHWIDPTSLEWLDLTVDRVPRLPVLLSITYRPEFTPCWIGRSHVTAMVLNRLTHRQRTDMITRVTDGKALPNAIADQIVDRTDGIPLFIEELTKAVVESGVLADAGDRYTLAGPTAPLAIPPTLQASLLARLDRLGPVKDVAQIGAALGRQFSHELISAVAPMPQQRLDDALADLVRAELIFRRGTPPDAEYTFKHALIKDAAYSTLLRARRQQLHARIAATLEDHFPEIVTAQPALLAQHCTEAAQNEKAVRYWLKAGQQAVTRSAMVEGVTQLQKGLDLLSSLPHSPERQQEELQIRVALGPALVATRGYAEPIVAETYARIRELSAGLGQGAELVSSLMGLWVYHLVRAELRTASSLSQELLLAARGSRPEFGIQAHAAAIATAFWRGNPVDVPSHAEQVLALYDPERHRGHKLYWEDPAIDALCYSGMALCLLGYPDRAQEKSKAALQLGPTIGHSFSLCTAMWWSAILSQMRRDLELASTLARSTRTLAHEQGFAAYAIVSPIITAWYDTCVSRVCDGSEEIKKAIAAYQSIGAEAILTVMRTLLADCHAAQGRSDEALAVLADALVRVNRTGEEIWEPEIRRGIGELLSRNDASAAERAYQEAIARARSQRTKWWELRASTSLARLWRDQGKRSEARDLLAPIYGWFTEGFDTPVLKEAKTLLEELA